jgi:hypothetical protein
MTKQAQAKDIAEDGLHPSAHAHLQWAEALAKEL